MSNNSIVGCKSRAKDEYLESSDKLIDGKKFQRGREKFQRDREGSLTGHLCSQPAHDQNVLGRCAQWETDSDYPPRGDTREHGGIMRVVVRRAHSRINLVTLPWEVRGLEARQRGKRKVEGGIKEAGNLFLKAQPRQPSTTFEFFSIYK